MCCKNWSANWHISNLWIKGAAAEGEVIGVSGPLSGRHVRIERTMARRCDEHPQLWSPAPYGSDGALCDLVLWPPSKGKGLTA